MAAVAVGGAILLVVLVIILMVFFVHRKNSSADSGFYESKFKYADLIQSGVLYPVAHVIDGDTINVHVSDPADAAGHDVTIRLIGMDTPETVDPRKPVQCFGPEASAKAKEMLASTSVYLEKDPANGDYEKYGRVLAYVRLANGSLYNDYMIQNGFAREYTYFKEAYKYQAQFKADEVAAKKARLGLWGKCGDGN
jgi:micrococcal nuclease